MIVKFGYDPAKNPTAQITFAKILNKTLVDNYNYYIIYFQKSQVILNNYCNILRKSGKNMWKTAVNRCLREIFKKAKTGVL